MECDLKYNIMIQIDSFIMPIQVSLTDGYGQNGKTKLTPVLVDIQQRQNKSKLAI